MRTAMYIFSSVQFLGLNNFAFGLFKQTLSFNPNMFEILSKYYQLSAYV